MSDLSDKVTDLIPGGGFFPENGENPMAEAAMDWFRGILDTVKLPESKIRFLSAKGSQDGGWAMIISAPKIMFFPPYVYGTFGAYYGKGKAWSIYVGLNLPPGMTVVNTGNKLVDEAIKFIKTTLGDSVNSIGLQYSGKVPLSMDLEVGPGSSLQRGFDTPRKCSIYLKGGGHKLTRYKP